MAIITLLSLISPPPPQTPSSSPNLKIPKPFSLLPPKPNSPTSSNNKRDFIVSTAALCLFSLTLQYPVGVSAAEPSSSPSPPAKSSLSGLVNTKSWFRFYGDGFSIRVPPQFEDVQEPEDDNGGLALYGDKVKPKTFAARFASSDGTEVVSVVTRPANSLKLTFLAAKDISDLGSLKEVAKIFVPGGSTLYAARTIKIKEEDGLRSYYFYEFGRDEQHYALVATINGGKDVASNNGKRLVSNASTGIHAEYPAVTTIENSNKKYRLFTIQLLLEWQHRNPSG